MGVKQLMNPISTRPMWNSQFSCCFCKDSIGVSPGETLAQNTTTKCYFLPEALSKKCLILRDATTTRFAFQCSTLKYFIAAYHFSGTGMCQYRHAIQRSDARPVVPQSQSKISADDSSYCSRFHCVLDTLLRGVYHIHILGIQNTWSGM